MRLDQCTISITENVAYNVAIRMMAENYPNVEVPVLQRLVVTALQRLVARDVFRLTTGSVM